MSRIGSDAWGRQRGGRLTANEQAGLFLGLLGRRVSARLSRRAGAAARLAEIDIALPDSALTRAALDHCVAECAPAIVNHSLRCFAWGTLLGARDNLGFDGEALAVASLLHDIELGRTERRERFACTCFACAGAEGARGFLAARTAPPPLIDRVCDAIALHLNPHVPPETGAEAHLLNAAAALDVVGAGLSGLHRDDRTRVLVRYPRSDLKTHMIEAMGREHATAPDTRAGLLVRLGFRTLIGRAPFDG